MRIVSTLKPAPIALLAIFTQCLPALAETARVDMHKITASGVEDKIGMIALADGEQGLELNVTVTGIPAGTHGFHVHQNGNCGSGEKDGRTQAGIAAGDHFDPNSTKSHMGPDGKGHKGDLPALDISESKTESAVVAPHLKLADIRGRALIIHEGGDTYSDSPEAGGGKGRIACGVIPSN